MNLYVFDLLGVFAFAVFASYDAHSEKFDLFGMFVCALLAGLGGGTIREVMLGNIPTYLTDYTYLVAVFAGMIAAILLYRSFNRVKNYFQVIDAVGLVTFAFIGAQRADAAGLSDIAIIFFAIITPVGGGIMKDIAMRKVPYIFQKDFYATPAILLGVFYVIFRDYMNIPNIAYTLIGGIFILRLLAIKYKYKLWARKDDKVLAKTPPKKTLN